MTKALRAALYLRVSTDQQTVENQRLALRAEAERRGWQIAGEYADEGISGAKGRDQRPQLDRLLKDAVRGRYDVVMVWALDRLGRSMASLIDTVQELEAVNVGLCIPGQAIDTTTPAGRLFFHVMGAIAEFERSQIRSRIRSGLDRVRSQGKRLGRKPIASTDPRVASALSLLAEGKGVNKVAKSVGLSNDKVAKLKALQTAPAESAPAPG